MISAFEPYFFGDDQKRYSQVALWFTTYTDVPCWLQGFPRRQEDQMVGQLWSAVGLVREERYVIPFSPLPLEFYGKATALRSCLRCRFETKNGKSVVPGPSNPKWMLPSLWRLVVLALQPAVALGCPPAITSGMVRRFQSIDPSSVWI